MIRRALGATLGLSLLIAAATASAAGRTVALRASDGTPLSAMLYEPGSQPAPAVVLVHMLTRTHADWNLVAEQLQQAGFVVLAIDLRGHGESGGRYDPAGDLGVMQEDVQAAVSLLQTRSDVSRGRIGIAGASIGANLAVLVGAADPSVRSLALLSPGLEYRGVKCEAAMKKYVPRPALLVAASNDPYALRSVRQLGTTGTGNEALTLEAVGHGTVMLARDPELGSRLVDWFKKTLL
jgi:alpha-beta hydrolase superfamily lysophospholipase